MTADPRGGRSARAAEIISRTRFVDHFLAPVRSVRGICEVCAEPQAGGGLRCGTCTAHILQAAALGTQTADRVVFAAHSVAGRQSDWDMHRYKAASPGPTNPSWMRVAGLAAHFGLMHRACLDAGRSGPVDAFAVVPSLSGRPSPHPVEALVRYLLSGVPVVPLSASAVERGDRDQKRSAVVQVLSRTPCSSAGSAQADDGMFSLEYPEIFAEPYDADHHFLTVSAPDPSGESLDAWHVDVCRWVPDDSEEKGEEEYSSASGEHLLRCVLPSTPSAEGVTELLSRVSAEPGVLKEWAQTTVGSPLEGTTFVVTSCLAG